MPVVSIVMPCYNSSLMISDAVMSVQSQVFSDWELIVVDDCSTDNSVEVVQCFMESDPRIKLIRLAVNSGVATARNRAIEAAQGRYIAFLDSDDMWLPAKLIRQIDFMQANDYPFTFTAYDKMNAEGDVFGHVGVPDKIDYYDLLKTCYVGCLTAVYDVGFFHKIFMPTNTKREDFSTWLRLLKETRHAYGLNETLAIYRVYNSQSSSNKVKMAGETWRVYRDIEQFGFFKASYYFTNYAIRGFLRTRYPKIARFFGVLK